MTAPGWELNPAVRRRSARARLGRERGHGTKRQLHGKCDSQRAVCLIAPGASRCTRDRGGHCQRDCSQSNLLCVRLSRTSSLSRPSERRGCRGGAAAKCLALSLAKRVLPGVARSFRGFAHLGARELAPHRLCQNLRCRALFWSRPGLTSFLNVHTSSPFRQFRVWPPLQT